MFTPREKVLPGLAVLFFALALICLIAPSNYVYADDDGEVQTMPPETFVPLTTSINESEPPVKTYTPEVEIIEQNPNAATISVQRMGPTETQQLDDSFEEELAEWRTLNRHGEIDPDRGPIVLDPYSSKGGVSAENEINEEDLRAADHYNNVDYERKYPEAPPQRF